MMDAQTIAEALDLKRSGKEWRGPCPVCGGSDKSTKFTITDARDRVLVHCFAGCMFTEIVAELRDRGLWPESTPEQKRTRMKLHTQQDRESAELVLFVYQENIAHGYQLNDAETRRYLDLKQRAGL